MRILSVNGNKRFFLGRYHKAVLAWLGRVDPDVVTVQEPWVNRPAQWWKLQGFNLVGASGDVLVWSRPHLAATVTQVESHRVAFSAGAYEVHAVHLDPYEGARRREQLDQLRCEAGVSGKPVVVLGDFNLAPRPQDSRYEEGAGASTGADERRAFEALQSTFGLVDVTAVNGTDPEFTFERLIDGKMSRSRSDLALLPRDLDPDWARVVYDHNVRRGVGAFTDHSAILVDLPARPGMTQRHKASPGVL